MSVKSLSVLFLAPAVLVATPALAQTTDRPAQEAAPAPAAPAAPPPPAAEAPAMPPPPPGPTPPESAAQQSKELTPPVDLATREKPPQNVPVNPWYVRPPYEITIGKGAEKWGMQIYGFAEADMMRDSTESFNDGMNSNVIAQNGTQQRNHPRLQFTIRNSRLGFKLTSPSVGGFKPSGVLETDFFGNQPGSPNVAVSESAYFNNPTWRIRHAWVKLESDYFDLMMGQMYHLLGWQNYFFASSAAFLGLPNELFNRTQQVRLSHTFKSDPVNFDIAVAAFRPVQRDSGLPDGEAGLRLAINHWKGINTPGNGGTAAFPAAIGVSGLTRQFAVNPLGTNPTGTAPSNRQIVDGWALAGDILLPIVPVKDSTDRGNALTVLGEATVGTADQDQFTGMTAGASMPTTTPIGTPYTQNVDNGLVAFDSNNTLHTMNWRTMLVGFQYYFPGDGRAFLAGNYSEGYSTNISSYYKKGDIFKLSRYADATVFFDATPAVRYGISYQYLWQRFVDNTSALNHRVEILALYFF